MRYHAYDYFLTLTNLLPFITSVIGLIAYRNLKRSICCEAPAFRHELDKQLTTMILVQILIYFCTFLPYSIQSMYALMITDNNAVFQAKMKFRSIITMHFSILSYAVRISLIRFYEIFQY